MRTLQDVGRPWLLGEASPVACDSTSHAPFICLHSQMADLKAPQMTRAVPGSKAPYAS